MSKFWDWTVQWTHNTAIVLCSVNRPISLNKLGFKLLVKRFVWLHMIAKNVVFIYLSFISLIVFGLYASCLFDCPRKGLMLNKLKKIVLIEKYLDMDYGIQLNALIPQKNVQKTETIYLSLQIFFFYNICFILTLFRYIKVSFLTSVHDWIFISLLIC